MKLHRTDMRISGSFSESSASGELVRAFIPHPLPPSDPNLGQEQIKQQGRAGTTSLLVYDTLKQQPVSTIAKISTQTEMSHVAVGRSVALLTELGIQKKQLDVNVVAFLYMMLISGF